METDEDELWSPENHDREFRGEVTLRTAIEQSLNVPMTRLALDVGPMQVVRAARRLGIRSRLRPVPSLALGTYEVTPLELTRAYATLAAGGRRPEIHPVHAVFDADRDLRLRVTPGSRRVYAADEAYLITSALRGVVERGTGRRVAAARVPVAGKTGTTNDYRDGWFVGYTTQLVVGVWVGFDDGRSLGLSGSRTGAPLFARFVQDAHVGPTPAEFRPPRGMERASVDPQSGLLADSFCTGAPEDFLEGTAPTETCAGGFWSRRSFGRLFNEYPNSEEEDSKEHANIRARALAMEDFFNRTRSAIKRRR
jgi:penicillin-binding protein 1B